MIKNKKLGKDFGKYLFGGIAWSALSISLAWLFIDYIGMYASIASTIIVVSGIIIRFYSYVLIRLIKNDFLKFVSTEIMFSLSTVALMTITIDIMKIPTLMAAPAIVAGLFILKFVGYIKIKLIA